MEAFMIYNLKVAACIAVFYLFYKLLLSRETFYRMNRVLLLAAIGLSFVLPFGLMTVEREIAPAVQTQYDVNMTSQDVAYSETTSPEDRENLALAAQQGKEIPWAKIGIALFLVGCATALGRIVWSFAGTVHVIRRGRKERLSDGLMISHHEENIAPFSWGRWIVISDADYHECAGQIISHEKAHIRYGHSYDLLATDLLSCLQWFNPAMWLLRSELRALHEFEADAAVLAEGADAKQYQLLLIKKAVGGRWYSVANSLNHSNLKNRITMMLRKRSSRWAGAKMLFVIPLMCIALGAFARTSYVVPDDKITTNQDTPQGFSGGMTAGVQENGTILVTLDGKGDAMLGAAGLLFTMQLPKNEQTRINNCASMLFALSDDDEAKAVSGVRPLVIIDGKTIAADVDVYDASKIASFVILDKQQGLEAYGTEGADGVVIITSKLPDKPSADFAVESQLDNERSWTNLYGLPEGRIGYSGSSGGGRMPTRQEEEAHRKRSENIFDKIPASETFTGIVNMERGKSDGSVTFTVYGVNDAMMAAASILIPKNFGMDENEPGVYRQTKNTELARIVYRLSRSAVKYPGLMAEPMPLCLVDDKVITKYRNVPTAEEIATMTVLDGKQGMAEYGEAGANGVVRIVSTKVIPTTWEMVEDLRITGHCYRYTSCGTAESTRLLNPKDKGMIFGVGNVAGGFSETNGILYVLNGKIISPKDAVKLRPSAFDKIEYIYDKKEIAKYIAGLNDYDQASASRWYRGDIDYPLMIQITTKSENR